MNPLFKTYPSPSCDQFIRKAHNLGQQLTTCKEGIKHVFLKNMYQVRETLVDKLDSFSIPYTDYQKLFTHMAKLDFESFAIKRTNSTIPILKLESALSNIFVIFLEIGWRTNPSCNCNTRDLIESFVDVLDGLATQSKTQMKLNFLDWDSINFPPLVINVAVALHQ